MKHANDRQIGGSHYKTGGLEHWDFVLLFSLPYLVAQMTRYLVRYRKHAGEDSIDKASHYLQKLIETSAPSTLLGKWWYNATLPWRLFHWEFIKKDVRRETALFCLENGMTEHASETVQTIVRWRYTHDNLLLSVIGNDIARVRRDYLLGQGKEYQPAGGDGFNPLAFPVSPRQG